MVATAEPSGIHLNPAGTVHGGLAATLLESCMGLAIQSTLEKGAGLTDPRVQDFIFAADYATDRFNSLFAAHLQTDLHLSTAMIATPIAIANLLAFLSSAACGWFSDRIGRRWAMIIPALFVIPLAPFYLFS